MKSIRTDAHKKAQRIEDSGEAQESGVMNIINEAYDDVQRDVKKRENIRKRIEQENDTQLSIRDAKRLIERGNRDFRRFQQDASKANQQAKSLERVLDMNYYKNKEDMKKKHEQQLTDEALLSGLLTEQEQIEELRKAFR